MTVCSSPRANQLGLVMCGHIVRVKPPGMAFQAAVCQAKEVLGDGVTSVIYQRRVYCQYACQYAPLPGSICSKYRLQLAH